VEATPVSISLDCRVFLWESKEKKLLRRRVVGKPDSCDMLGKEFKFMRSTHIHHVASVRAVRGTEIAARIQT